MMMEPRSKRIGFSTLFMYSGIEISFIILKLFNVISWSWWWVLAPIYAPIVAAFSFVLLIVILDIFNLSDND